MQGAHRGHPGRDRPGGGVRQPVASGREARPTFPRHVLFYHILFVCCSRSVLKYNLGTWLRLYVDVWVYTSVEHLPAPAVRRRVK